MVSKAGNLVGKVFVRQRRMQIWLAVVVVVLGAVFVLELVVGVGRQDSGSDVHGLGHGWTFREPNSSEVRPVTNLIRPGLFKASTGVVGRPMAEATIERIKSQLKLRCIMEMKGEPTAYINIKAIGLKRCGVGDNVGDIFTVVDIGKRNVVITIVGHKVTLSL